MSQAPLLKDTLNKNAIDQIGTVLNASFAGFDSKHFSKTCMQGLETLELKQRVQHIIQAMHQQLGDDYEYVAHTMPGIIEHWQKLPKTQSNHGFLAWPIIDYNAAYGIDHPQLALPVLEKLTPLFSAEFAIQHFLLKHHQLSHKFMLNWSTHQNEHVRRLASEGLRPRLPWGIRMQNLCNDPGPILPILENLKSDQSPYVRKSVANNINDISKDNPDKVIKLCEAWLPNASKETLWIIKHGTRTLIKQSHPEVFSLLGYQKANIKAKALRIDKDPIKLGNNLEFSLELSSNSKHPQPLIIDYVIHFKKANGELSEKVFKLKTLELQPGQRLVLEKKHPFRLMTTRKLYSGEHQIEAIVNGERFGKTAFTLKC